MRDGIHPAFHCRDRPNWDPPTMSWETAHVQSWNAGAAKIQLKTPRTSQKRPTLMSWTAGVTKIEFKTLRMAWKVKHIQSSTAGVSKIEVRTPKMAWDKEQIQSQRTDMGDQKHPVLNCMCEGGKIEFKTSRMVYQTGYVPNISSNPRLDWHGRQITTTISLQF